MKSDKKLAGRLRQDAQDRELDAAEHLLPLRRQEQPHLRHAPTQLDVLAQGELPGGQFNRMKNQWPKKIVCLKNGHKSTNGFLKST